MKQVYHTVTTQQLSGFWKQVGFHGCFALFSVVFFFAHVSSWAHVPVDTQEVSIRTSSTSETGFVFNTHHANPNPFNIPVIFVEKTEGVDETNSGNEHDAPLKDVSIPTPSAGFHTGKSLFQQLKLVNESRDKISLFVLHHSWKSFLG